MKHHLSGLNTLSSTGVAQNLTGVLAVFDIIDLPADDHSAEEVQEQIQIVEATFDGRRQVGDVPTVDFIGRSRRDGPRLGLRAGRPLSTPMRQLPDTAQRSEEHTSELQ